MTTSTLRYRQRRRHIGTTEDDKGDLLLSFPMGGSCGSCRPLRPDMGVLVGLVCTDPLRGCALQDRESDGHGGERQVRAPPDGGGWGMRGLAMLHPHHSVRRQRLLILDQLDQQISYFTIMLTENSIINRIWNLKDCVRSSLNLKPKRTTMMFGTWHGGGGTRSCNKTCLV